MSGRKAIIENAQKRLNEIDGPRHACFKLTVALAGSAEFPGFDTCYHYAQSHGEDTAGLESVAQSFIESFDFYQVGGASKDALTEARMSLFREARTIRKLTADTRGAFRDEFIKSERDGAAEPAAAVTDAHCCCLPFFSRKGNNARRRASSETIEVKI